DPKVLLDEPSSAAIPLEEDDHREIAAKQFPWDLDQQSRAVAALAVGVETSAMRQPGERLHAEGDRLVAESGGGHEAHAACRPGVGEIPRPGKACPIERWGH